MTLKNFFTNRRQPSVERRVYELIVAQARQPWFYADLNVPDTVEGRYDMIILHSFVFLERLSGAGKAAEGFSQRYFDELFKDMDRSLRELGVGDLSVGKKIRKMAEMFYGRAEVYRSALQQAGNDDAEPLKTALARNIYDTKGSPAGLDQLAVYVLRLQEVIAQQDCDTILTGEINFPEPGL